MAFSAWHAQNPDPNPSTLGKLRWRAHTWGRQEFAKSFARGGFAATVFAPTPTEAFMSPWRSKAEQGSRQYTRNLEKLSRLYPQDLDIQKAVGEAKAFRAPSKLSAGMTAIKGLGHVAVGAFLLAPAFTTDGPIEERMRAVTSGAAGWAGFDIGMKAGIGTGAAIGTAILPGVGSAIGSVVGGAIGAFSGAFAAEHLADTVSRIPDRMVATERNRRKLNWGDNTAAFQTQRASTMRQRSLAAMNRGQMSARSLLGQEATFVHR